MKKAYLLAGFSILMWSTVATISKLMIHDRSSIQVLTMQMIFAVITLFMLSLKQHKIQKIKSLNRKDFLILGALGVVGIFLNKYFFYQGIARLNASQAFSINYLWPLFIVLLGCVFLGESMNPRKILAVVISFTGVFFVATRGEYTSISKDGWIGVLFIALDALSYALFSVLNKKRGYDQTLAMLIYHVITLLLCVALCTMEGEWFIPSWTELLGFAWLGVFTAAFAYTAWALALQEGNTAKIANLAYLTPVLSLVWTTLFLDEKLDWYDLFGLLLIILGVFVQMTRKKPEKKEEHQTPSGEN